jgi:hypothetical protein
MVTSVYDALQRARQRPSATRRAGAARPGAAGAGPGARPDRGRADAKVVVEQGGGLFLGAVLNGRRNHIPEFLYQLV